MEYTKSQAPEVCAYLNLRARRIRKIWFAMRVTYRREAEVKRLLDAQDIRNYIPMHYVDAGKGVKTLEPVIRNLIFVHCTQERMTAVNDSGRLPFMQYMMNGRNGGKIIVPDTQMEQFIAASSHYEEPLKYYPAGELNLSKGQKVKITAGVFQGCEGTFMKVKGMRSRKVVIEVQGVMSVALVSVPSEFIEIAGQ